MVSMYHHLRATRGGDVDFLRMVRDGDGLYPCHWHEHVRAWQDNPYDADIVTIRYEDLLADGVKELRRLCEFVGVERDPAVLEAAVDNAAFENMRELEGRPGSRTDPMWPADRPFVRRGEAGGWRDETPPEVLEAFMAHASETLDELGYPVP